LEDGICVLIWKKSKDDGGATIEHYQVKNVFNIVLFEKIKLSFFSPLKEES
jgi:hypothetical protein